jgi:hypothetical protein
MLFADLELDTLAARKRLFDAVGHHNRPDVFHLEVDDRPNPAVATRSQGDCAHLGFPEISQSPAAPIEESYR